MTFPADGGSSFNPFNFNNSPFSPNWTQPTRGPVAQSRSQAQQWVIQAAQQAAAAAKTAAEAAARAAAAARARAVASKAAADKAATTAGAANATQAQKNSAKSLREQAATDEAAAEKKESTADVAAKDQKLKDSLLDDMNNKRAPNDPSSATIAARSEYDAAVRNDALVNAPDPKSPTPLTDAKTQTATAQKTAVTDAKAVADAKAKGGKPSDAAVAKAAQSQADWFAAIRNQLRVAAVDASANGKDPNSAIDHEVDEIVQSVKKDGYFDPQSVRDALTKPSADKKPSLVDQAKAETPAQRQLLLEYASVQKDGSGQVSAAKTAFDTADAAATKAEKVAGAATTAAKSQVQFGPYVDAAAARAAQEAPLDAPTGPGGLSPRQLQAKAVQLRQTADAAKTKLQTLEQAYGHNDPDHPDQDTLGMVQADYNKRGADLVVTDARQTYLATLDSDATPAQLQAAYNAWQTAVDGQTLAGTMQSAIAADGEVIDARAALATAVAQQDRQVQAQPKPLPFSNGLDLFTPKDPTIGLDYGNAADRARVHPEGGGKYDWVADDGSHHELNPVTASVWAAHDQLDAATKKDTAANAALKQVWTDQQPGPSGLDVTGELQKTNRYTQDLGTATSSVTQAQLNLRTAIDDGQSATVVQQRRVELGRAMQAQQLAEAQVAKITAMQTLRNTQLWDADAAGQPPDTTALTNDVRAAVQKVAQLQGTTPSPADESALRYTTLPQETSTLARLDQKIEAATPATSATGGVPAASAPSGYRALLDQRDYLAHKIEAQKAQLGLLDAQRAALAAPFAYSGTTAKTAGVDLYARSHSDAADAALTWGITPGDDGRSVVLSGLPSNIKPEDVKVAKDGDGWYVTFDKSSGAYAMHAYSAGKGGSYIVYDDGSGKDDIAIEKGHRYRLNADAAQLWEATNTNPDAGDSALVAAQQRASAATKAVQLDPLTDATGIPIPTTPTVTATADPKTIAATTTATTATTTGGQPLTTIDFGVDQTGNKAAADARVVATGKALATAKAAVAAGNGDPQTLQAQLASAQNASDLAVSEQSAVGAVLQWQQANFARQVFDANARAGRSPMVCYAKSPQENADDQRATATAAVASWQSTKNRVDLAEADSAVTTTQAAYDQWRSDHSYMLGSATESAPYQDLQAAIAQRDGAKRQLAAGAITTSDAAQKAFVATNLAPGQENDPHAMYQLFMKDPKTMAQSIINSDYAQNGGIPTKTQGRVEIANRVATELGFQQTVAFDPNDPAGNLQRLQTQNLFTNLTHDQQDALDKVVKQITSVGGDQAGVTVLPVVYAVDADKDKGGGIVKTALFKVQDKDHPDQVKYVDEYGERYDSIDDYRANNNLPVDGVNLVMPEDGNFTLDGNGNVKLYSGDARTETGWQHFRREYHVDAIVGGLAIVGGVLLEFGSAGTLTPVAGAMILGGASLYGVATSAQALQNRSAHGLSINPFTDREAGMDWLNLGASALALPSVGSAGRAASLMLEEGTAARVALEGGDAARVAFGTIPRESSQFVQATGRGAQWVGGAAMVDGGAYMAQNWSRMDGDQKWEQGGMFLLNLASMRTHDAAEAFQANAQRRLAVARAEGVPVKAPVVVEPASTPVRESGITDATNADGTPITTLPTDGSSVPIDPIDPVVPATVDPSTAEPTAVDVEPSSLPVLELPSSVHRDEQIVVDGINNIRKNTAVASAVEATRAVRPKAVDGADNDVASTDASARRDTARANYDRLNLDGENAIRVSRGPHAGERIAGATAADDVASLQALLDRPAVKALVERSSTLQALLASADAEIVTLRLGQADGGSFTERSAGGTSDGGDTIVSIDPSRAQDPATLVNVLAHELAHANAGDATPARSGDALAAGLADEGRARLLQLRVRDEILSSGGPDIFPHAPAEDLRIYADAKQTGNDDEAVSRLAALMADRRTSSDPTKTYAQLYGESQAIAASPAADDTGARLPPSTASGGRTMRLTDSGLWVPGSTRSRVPGESELVNDIHAHHGGNNAGAYMRLGAADAPPLSQLFEMTRGNVLIQRVPQTAEPYYLNLNADHSVFEGHLTLRPDGTIRLDQLIAFKDDAAPAIQAGDYTRAQLEEAGLRFGSQLPVDAPVKPMTFTFNVEPGLKLGYRGMQRDVGLIDQVLRDLPPGAQRRAYIGLTAGNPAAHDNVEALLAVLNYANRVDPDGSWIRIPGLGETTLAKEGVTAHLELRPDLLHPEAIDRLASKIGEMGGMMVVHADSGTTRVIGAPAEHGLLVHGPSDYQNVEPLLGFFRQHPDVQFVWAHAGGLGRTVQPGPEHLDMVRAVLGDPSLKHVHIDLSWDVVSRYIADPAMRHEWANLINDYPDRFIYGSDSVAAKTPEVYGATFDTYRDSGFLDLLTDRGPLLRSNFDRLVETSTENVTRWRLQNADLLQQYPLDHEAFTDLPRYAARPTDLPGDGPIIRPYPDEPLSAAGDPPQATMVKGSQWPDLLAQMKSGRLSADGEVYVYRVQDSAMDPATSTTLDAASRRLQGWMHLPEGSTKPRWLGQSDPGTSPGVRADVQKKLGGMGTAPWSDQFQLIVSRTSPQALREAGRIDDVRWVGPDVAGLALPRAATPDAPEAVAEPVAESISKSKPTTSQADDASSAAANDPDRRKFAWLFGGSTVGALATGAAASALTHNPAWVLDPNLTGAVSFIYRGVVGAGRARLAQRIDFHVSGLKGDDAPRHLDWLERTVVRKGGLIGIPQADRTAFGDAVTTLRTDGGDEGALAVFDGASKKLLSPGTPAGRINDTLQLTTLAVNNGNSAAWFGQHGFDASSPQAWSTAAFLGANVGLSTVNFAGRLGYRAGLQSIRDRVTMKAAQVGVMSGYASGSLPLAFVDATTAPGALGFTKAALDVTFGSGAAWQAGRDVRAGVRNARQKEPLSYRVAPMVILGTGVAARMALQLIVPTSSGNGPSQYAQQVPTTVPTGGPGPSTVAPTPSTAPAPSSSSTPSSNPPSNPPSSNPPPPVTGTPSPPPVQPPPPPPPPPPPVVKPVVVEAGDPSSDTLWGIAEAHVATLLARGAIDAARRQGGDDAVVATALKQLFQINPERHFDPRLMDRVASAAEGDPDTIQPGWKINVDSSA